MAVEKSLSFQTGSLERYFFYDEHVSAFFRYIKEGNVKELKKMFRANERFLHTTNKADESPLAYALIHEQLSVAKCIAGADSTLLSDLKHDPRFIFYLFERGKKNAIKWLLFESSAFFDCTDYSGKPLMFYVFDTLDTSFANEIYELNKAVIYQKQDRFTALQYLSQKRMNGYPMLCWLLKSTGYRVKCDEDAKQIAHSLLNEGYFEDELMMYIIDEKSLPFFFRYFSHIKESPVCHELIFSLEKIYAKQIICDHEPSLRLQGDDLIGYYNATITDVEEVKNPFKKLIKLFFTIKKTEYLASLEFEKMPLKKDVFVLKMKEIKLCKELFFAIKTRKPDDSIPRGKEGYYYTYLDRILKHLFLYLNEDSKKDQRIIFLRDLSAASGNCYTHFGTVLRSIYSRISRRQDFFDAEKRFENPAEIFSSDFKKHLRKSITAHLLERLGDQNIHVHYIVQKILQELRKPLYMDLITDIPQNFTASLILARESLLEIPFHEQDPFLLQNEQALYEDTKSRFYESFLQVFDTVEFIFNHLLFYLGQSLQKEGSEPFLAQLVAFLETQKISSHEVIKYQDEKGFKIRTKGVLKILEALPRELVI